MNLLEKRKNEMGVGGISQGKRGLGGRAGGDQSSIISFTEYRSIFFVYANIIAS